MQSMNCDCPHEHIVATVIDRDAGLVLIEVDGIPTEVATIDASKPERDARGRL